MAHIHLHEGTFPIEWAVLWSLIAACLIAIFIYILRGQRRVDIQRISLAAIFAALAFIVSQIEIPLFGGVHLSFTSLIGISTGIPLGSLVILVINIFDAGIGHEGWGLVGANTLIQIVELCVAYGAYKGLRRVKLNVFGSGCAATILALLVGVIVMVGIIVVSGIQGINEEISSQMGNLTLLIAVNLVAGVVEAVVTGSILQYLCNVRPEMIGEARGREPEKG
jgi:cobalt/nickel transport system permease protein